MNIVLPDTNIILWTFFYNLPSKSDFYSGDENFTEGEKWLNEAVSRFTEKPNKKNLKLIDIMPNEDIEPNKKLLWKK